VDLQMTGRVALVTGAGRGIGAAVALALGNEGAYVVVNDIDGKVAEELCSTMLSRRLAALPVQADITNPSQVEKMVHLALNEYGRIDILVNNAGIAYSAGEPTSRNVFLDTSLADWDRDIQLILYGTVLCTKAVLFSMMEGKKGRIVNISSDVAKCPLGLTRISTYSTAKAGLNALTRSLATELAPYGITVNAVSAGMVKTTRASFAENFSKERPASYEYYRMFEREILGRTPLKRIGTPEDVAGMVLFLASDLASWITGQTISVNGGLYMA
jgi:NAD(P)-dependent dehydrogenase (short-subunit alcohol dehydrogenase family)